MRGKESQDQTSNKHQHVKEEEGFSVLWQENEVLKGFRKQAACDHNLTCDDKINCLILCSRLECHSISKYSLKASFQFKKNISSFSRCEEDLKVCLTNVVTVSQLFLPFFGNALSMTCFPGNMPGMKSLKTALILFLDNILTHIIEKGSFMIGAVGK